MKQLFLSLILLAGFQFTQASVIEEPAAQSSDADSIRSTKSKKTDVTFTWGKEERSSKDSTRTRSKAPGVSYGLTLSRFDLGFSKLVDNGSFTLSDQNSFLDYHGWKTSTVGFDILQFGYRFNSNFKIYLSGGFDWTHIRLRRDITIRKDAPTLQYDESDIDFDKNRFSSTYIRLPLSFEWRSKDDDNGKKFRIIAGPDFGFLINGKVKQKSDENGKQKFNDNYHFTKFRYGGFVRLGYGSTGLFAKYYLNDMFENSPAQEGLQNMSFGVSFGF